MVCGFILLSGYGFGPTDLGLKKRRRTIQCPAVQSSCLIPFSELSQVVGVEDQGRSRHLGRSIARKARLLDAWINVHIFWVSCISSLCLVDVVSCGIAAFRNKGTVIRLELWHKHSPVRMYHCLSLSRMLTAESHGVVVAQNLQLLQSTLGIIF